MTTSFASIINLGGLREDLRIRTGLPEEGDSGKTRANRVLNYALREFFGDLPHMFEREEFRFQLGQKYSDSTLDVCPTDARVFRLTSVDITLLPTSGILTGRWIDITDTAGKVHRKRICKVATLNTGTLWGDGSIVHLIITVDTPWINATDTQLAYVAFTLEYPLPPDWREVSEVYRLDGSSAPRALTHVYPEELERLLLTDDWLAEGTVERWSRGDFAQIRAPHDTPTIAQAVFAAPAASDPNKVLAWGWDSAGTPLLHGAAGTAPPYEAAGTFDYCYCLGWGYLDLTPTFRDLDSREPTPTAYTPRPFYISAPSLPSGEVTVEWQGPCPQVTSVDQDLTAHYTGPITGPSYHMSGLQKWWFRRRTAVQASPVAPLPVNSHVEADKEWYLFRIDTGYDTLFSDKGDWGQPVIDYPLKEFAGHQTIRFDKIPNDGNVTIIVRGRRLPDRLKLDSDMARCPTDCMDAIVYLAASILVGERGADMKKAGEYRALYELAVKKLRRKYAVSAGKPSPVGSIEGTSLPAGAESRIVLEDT
jgi:hypothetical protein